MREIEDDRSVFFFVGETGRQGCQRHPYLALKLWRWFQFFFRSTFSQKTTHGHSLFDNKATSFYFLKLSAVLMILWCVYFIGLRGECPDRWRGLAAWKWTKQSQFQHAEESECSYTMHMHPHMHPHTLSFIHTYHHISMLHSFLGDDGTWMHAGDVLARLLWKQDSLQLACNREADGKLIFDFHEPKNSPVPSLSEANSQTRSLSKRQLTDGAKLRMCDGPFDIIRLSFKVLQTDLSRVNDEPARWSELYACFLDLFGPKAAYSVVIVVRMNDIPFGLGYLKIRCVFLDQ